jgi:O-succinylhomoserine sulfhydrylase
MPLHHRDPAARIRCRSTLIDGRDLKAWEQAVRPETKLFFLESPANPTLDLIDIAAVAQIGKPRGILTVVDNVFATPMLQKPLALGADIVTYSATKHIDGQGRCLGGVVLATREHSGWAAQGFPAPYWPVAQPVQCLGHAEGA